MLHQHPEYMEKIENCHVQEQYGNPDVHKTAKAEDRYFDYKAAILGIDRDSMIINVA